MWSKSVDKPTGDVTVFLNAPVAQEWPPAAHIFAVVYIHANDDAFLFYI